MAKILESTPSACWFCGKVGLYWAKTAGGTKRQTTRFGVVHKCFNRINGVDRPISMSAQAYHEKKGGPLLPGRMRCLSCQSEASYPETAPSAVLPCAACERDTVQERI